MRPELSEENENWLPKHRYYELKHFCLQYPDWKKAVSVIDGVAKAPVDIFVSDAYHHGNPTETAAEKRLYFTERIDMVEKAAYHTDASIAPYLIKGVTEGLSYDILNARTNVPCGKEAYYKLYRRFFRILSDARN